MNQDKLYIGIDPGIVSGIAVWDSLNGWFDMIDSMAIHELFDKLKFYHEFYAVIVYIENPNTWVPFGGKSDPMRLQGAGAVKQTFKHILEFMEDKGIDFRPTKLQGTMKKVKSEYFKKLTGYQGKTNEHGRDAAMLVFGK